MRHRRRALDRALLPVHDALRPRRRPARRAPRRWRRARRRAPARPRRLGALPDARGDASRRFSRHRERAPRAVPRPDAGVGRPFGWAWDKRNTYRLAERARHPDPAHLVSARARATWTRSTGEPPFVDQAGDQGALHLRDEGEGVARDTPTELAERFEQARRHRRAGRGDRAGARPRRRRASSSPTARSSRTARRSASMVARRRRQHPPEFGRASTFVETVELPQLEELSERLPARDRLLRPRRARVQARPARRARTSCSTSTRAPGATTPSGRAAGVDFPYLLFADQLGLPVEAGRAPAGVRWVRLATDLPDRCRSRSRGGRLDWRAYLRSLRSRTRRVRLQPRRSAARRWPSSRSSPISRSQRGF